MDTQQKSEVSKTKNYMPKEYSYSNRILFCRRNKNKSQIRVST